MGHDPDSLKNALLKPALLIVLALPLLAAGLFLRHHAGSIVGPLAIAVDEAGTRVAVARSGKVYHLDADGASRSVDEDLLDPEARHAGLAFVGNELFASPDPDGDLLRCTDTACSLFSDDEYAPRGAVHVFAEANRLWFSETDTERVQRYFPDGRRIDMPVSDLTRPGSLWLEGDQLYVANAGSNEIRRYRMHKRGIDEPEAFATFSDGDEHAPVNQPCCFVRDGDGFIAAFNDAAGRQGTLVRIDASGAVEPLAVAGLENPVALARLGDAVLVVDEERMQVLKVTADGTASVFGDEAFRTVLGDGASLRASLRMAGPALAVLAALLAALGGSWLLQRVGQRRPDPALVLHADTEGIRWLPRESDRAGVHLPWALVVSTPLALLPALAAGWLGQAGIAALWALLVLGIAAARPLIVASRARLPNDLRVGTRNRHLVVADTDKGLREFPLPQVQWDETELRPEPDLSIPLVRNGQALFHAPTLAAALLPQLAPAQRIKR